MVSWVNFGAEYSNAFLHRGKAFSDRILLDDMNEIIFLVEEAIEGGFNARALGESIFTEGDNMDDLRANIRDAVDCHFGVDEKPKVIRLHFVSEEVMAA